MIPKVGDVVRLNHDFLEIWFKRGNTSFEKEEVWNKRFAITGVKKS